MRNAANKMTNPIDPYTENNFLSFIENLSDMELSVVLTLALSGCHWLRRPLHGSLHRSWVDAVYPTLKLICDFWPSKFSHYPSRPVPLPEVFVTTRPDPVPKSKTTTRQSLVVWYRWYLLHRETLMTKPPFKLFWDRDHSILVLHLPCVHCIKL